MRTSSGWPRRPISSDGTTRAPGSGSAPITSSSDRGDAERAARCAFWLAFGLLGAGDFARGGGWLARARRLLDDGRRDCVEQGYLLFPVGLSAILEGDVDTAYATFAQAAGIGERFRDPDLVTLARHGQGRALIRMGRTAEGMALLDEVMVAVTSGEASPIIVGDVYCSVIEACQESFDLRRARSWTAALGDWCASQPDLVPYRGQCLLHRAEIMTLDGAWQDAMDEALQAGRRLAARPGAPSVGAAFYQQAELHRLRGEFSLAENAYREASRAGREPQPGLARLRLAQGRIGDAQAAIRRVVDETQDHLGRSRLLPAHVEIMLAAGDLTAARIAADELSELAGAPRRAPAAGGRDARRGRRAPRRGPGASRPRRPARRLDGLAGARGPVRGGPRPSPPRARLRAARATRTRPRWSWTPRDASSSGSGRRPTSPGRRRGPGEDPRPRAGSPPARWRCCASWPPARPTGRWPPTSS